MRHAVILAGGSGTRLWPASRRSRPKQLLSLTNSGPMIAAAVEIGRRVADRVMIVTSAAQVEATTAAVPSVEVIAEPVGRNTAAAIGLAGATIAARDRDATITVLPADHYVRDRIGMVSAIDACLDYVEKTDAIALVGIPPTRAETGYGYLEMAPGPSDGLRPVLRFVEKPDRATAEEYLASGRHLWNAGIFCLTTRRLMTELDMHLPKTATAARMVADGPNAGLVYEDLPSISFDKGVMEKVSRVVAVPAAVGWSDVGSWSALPEVLGTSEVGGNTFVGERIYTIDSSGCVIVTDGADDKTLIATVGVSDLIIVKAGDAILVARKDQAQRVKELVEALGEHGWERHL